MLQSEQSKNNNAINGTYTRQESETAYKMFVVVANEAK